MAPCGRCAGMSPVKLRLIAGIAREQALGGPGGALHDDRRLVRIRAGALLDAAGIETKASPALHARVHAA